MERKWNSKIYTPRTKVEVLLRLFGKAWVLYYSCNAWLTRKKIPVSYPTEGWKKFPDLLSLEVLSSEKCRLFQVTWSCSRSSIFWRRRLSLATWSLDSRVEAFSFSGVPLLAFCAIISSSRMWYSTSYASRGFDISKENTWNVDINPEMSDVADYETWIFES